MFFRFPILKSRLLFSQVSTTGFAKLSCHSISIPEVASGNEVFSQIFDQFGEFRCLVYLSIALGLAVLKVPSGLGSLIFLENQAAVFDSFSSAVILSCLNKFYCSSCCCCNGMSPINFVLDRVRFCGIALLSATLILPNS